MKDIDFFHQIIWQLNIILLLFHLGNSSMLVPSYYGAGDWTQGLCKLSVCLITELHFQSRL